ncbi:hypothetical protein Rsub_10221 [Raphidocelis subcapitata]|uniref:Exonuclease domain-containing protein n=1 Tax=Raphidocelis subcapitata TaxID=307507 RepID=A0A2V0PD78_9CHLO|nr:hypothetical protein Rsub_10221 [Raphidocelis subcapitata]|eukprot:GBF97796.1 hypothetical protein Rsub_10221 [Raphidocelis subcapitata]
MSAALDRHPPWAAPSTATMNDWRLRLRCGARRCRRRPLPRRETPPPRAAPEEAAAPALLLPAVAVDVEFSHWRAPGRGEAAVAAWVAAVDEGGATLLDARIGDAAGQLPPPAAQWRHCGGVPPGECAGAPPRGQVVARLLQLLEGRLLVGHGVARDAAALGLEARAAPGAPPGFLCLRSPCGAVVPAYDSKAFPGFQGRGGGARTLAQLVRQHLGRELRGGADAAPAAVTGDGAGSSGGRPAANGPAPPPPAWVPSGGRARHDAVEDARAAAELFARVARPRLLLDAAAAGAPGAAAAYDRLVGVATAQLLARAGGGGVRGEDDGSSEAGGSGGGSGGDSGTRPAV